MGIVSGVPMDIPPPIAYEYQYFWRALLARSTSTSGSPMNSTLTAISSQTDALASTKSISETESVLGKSSGDGFTMRPMMAEKNTVANRRPTVSNRALRSEEHTSELQ